MSSALIPALVSTRRREHELTCSSGWGSFLVIKLDLNAQTLQIVDEAFADLDG
jgi:hypothetical protein